MNALATRFRDAHKRDFRQIGANLSRPLGEDELRAYVPSIFAEAPHASRSSRYGYIPTIEVVRGLEREGFAPVFACEANARDESKHGYTKHMLRFRQNALNVPAPAACFAGLGGVPELVMVNSHDGSTAYQLLAGFFRFVCANGMICGEGFGEIRVRHNANTVRDVIAGAFETVKGFSLAIEQAQAMRALALTPEQRNWYAEGALMLKYLDTDTGKLESPVTTRQVLAARRSDDVQATPDLWTTFNVVQENLVRGGIRHTSVDAQGRRRRNTTRAVNGIDGNVKLNRALWTLTEKFAGMCRGETVVTPAGHVIAPTAPVALPALENVG